MKSSIYYRLNCMLRHLIPSMGCLLLILIASCEDNKSGDAAKDPEGSRTKNEGEGDPAGNEFLLSSHHALISTRDPAFFEFTQPIFKKSQIGHELKGAVTISPHAPFKAIPISKNRIEINPLSPWPAGESFRIQFSYAPAPPALPSIEKISINQIFETIKPAFHVTGQGMEAQADDQFYYVFTVNTSDYEPSSLVQKFIDLDELNKRYQTKWKSKWQHSQSKEFTGGLTGHREHVLTLGPLQRTLEDQNISIEFSGSAIQSKKRQMVSFVIPPKGIFSVRNVSINDAGLVQGNSPAASTIVIRFSEQLQKDQVLEGLIEIGDKSYTSTIDSNKIILYLKEDVFENTMLKLFPGIRSHDGQKLSDAFEYMLPFKPLSPEIKLLSRAVIAPASDSTKQTTPIEIALEAVNIKSFQLAAFRIPQPNISYFFQENDFRGLGSIQRYGRLEWHETLEITDLPLNQRKTYNIDISNYFKNHPRDFYIIYASINRMDSIYPCSEDDANVPLLVAQNYTNRDHSYNSPLSYDYHEINYNAATDQQKQNVNWNHKNNPCKDAYFRYNSKNTQSQKSVFVTSIGIIAKSHDDTLSIFVRSLADSGPMANALVSIKNYQMQTIAEGETDPSGFFSFPKASLSEKLGEPYLVVVKNKNNIGYLPIKPQSMRPTSHFETSGSSMPKDYDGFIFAERDIWRPGDTIHLFFILRSTKDNPEGGGLPAKHPATLKAYDPRGTLKHSSTQQSQDGIIYAFKVGTSESDPTGKWRVEVKFGNYSFSQNLNIETIRPNRLESAIAPAKTIMLTWDKNAFTSSEDLKLNAKWLHGAPASDLKAQLDVSLQAKEVKFPNYSEYKFGDAVTRSIKEKFSLFDGNLNKDGVSEIKISLPELKNKAGQYDAYYTAKIYEPSGGFSIQTHRADLEAYDSYVGIKSPVKTPSQRLETGKPHQFELILVGADGNLLQNKASAQVEIFNIGWSWWWEEGGDSFKRYVNRYHRQIIKEENLQFENGKASLLFSVSYPEWGRYMIRACLGNQHCSSQVFFVDWPNWYRRSGDEIDLSATMLTIETDKPEYEIGEVINISSPKLRKQYLDIQEIQSLQGSALLSVEREESVIANQWVSLRDLIEGKVGIKATRDMFPNAYISITTLQAIDNKVGDLPIRLYGIKPIKITDQQSVLTPLLSVPDKLKPNEKFTLSIKEENEKPMSYVINMVDEGLLNLTNFAVVNPHDYFYRKRSHSLKTWDVYDNIMLPGGPAVERLVAMGGDGYLKAAANPSSDKRRFPPVVESIGPFQLKKGESAKHDIVMPNYFGAVRFMATAASSASYGTAELRRSVKDKIILLPSAPKALRYGDVAQIPVTVFFDFTGGQNRGKTPENNHENKLPENLILTIKCNAGCTAIGETKIDLSKALKAELPNVLQGDFTGTFKIEATAMNSQASITISANQGDNPQQSSTIHLPLEPHTETYRTTTSHIIEPGKSLEEEIVIQGIPETNKITIALSSSPSFQLYSRLEYLMRYPHGCLEQTLSTAFPQIFLADILTLSDQDKEKTANHVAAALTKLSRFLQPNGDFTYWPYGGSYVNEWANLYAGHFLIEAKNHGFATPPEMLEKWKTRQVYLANQHNFDNLAHRTVAAYRLFLLSLAGIHQSAAINRIVSSDADLETLDKWLIAAAIFLGGNEKAANEFVVNANTQLPETLIRKANINIFQTRTRDAALLLQALTIMKRPQLALTLFDDLKTKLNSKSFMSTQEIGISISAISSYLSQLKSASKLSATIDILGLSEILESSIQVQDPASDGRVTGKLMIASKSQQISYKPLLNNENRITIKNSSDQQLFIEINQEHYPKFSQVLQDLNQPSQNAISFESRNNYFAIDKIEQTSNKGSTFITQRRYALGDSVEIDWEASNKSGFRQPFVVVELPIASGFEFTELTSSSAETTQYAPDYVDVRDNIKYMYFDLSKSKGKISAAFTAAYKGEFFVPAVRIYNMYDETQMFKIPARKITIE